MTHSDYSKMSKSSVEALVECSLKPENQRITPITSNPADRRYQAMLTDLEKTMVAREIKSTLSPF
ncbi:hypothetical protein D3C76_706410 [compost metagenome]